MYATALTNSSPHLSGVDPMSIELHRKLYHMYSMRSILTVTYFTTHLRESEKAGATHRIFHRHLSPDELFADSVIGQ